MNIFHQQECMMGNHLLGQTATVVQLHFKSTSRLFFTAVVLIQVHLSFINHRAHEHNCSGSAVESEKSCSD